MQSDRAKAAALGIDMQTLSAHMAAMLSGGHTNAPRPGVTQSQALAILDQSAKDMLPQRFRVDYAGERRQFQQEGTTMLVTLAFALIIIDYGFRQLWKHPNNLHLLVITAAPNSRRLL